MNAVVLKQAFRSAANPKLIKDRALLKRTCHFTFQTLTFHSYKKTEFKNVFEIAVKSAVKVTNATLALQKYPALIGNSFNRLTSSKASLQPQTRRRADGGSGPRNINIH